MRPTHPFMLFMTQTKPTRGTCWSTKELFVEKLTFLFAEWVLKLFSIMKLYIKLEVQSRTLLNRIPPPFHKKKKKRIDVEEHQMFIFNTEMTCIGEAGFKSVKSQYLCP